MACSFIFENCSPFGIMYARRALLQGVGIQPSSSTLPTPAEAGPKARGSAAPPVGNELWRNPVFVPPPLALAGGTTSFTSQVNCSLGPRYKGGKGGAAEKVGFFFSLFFPGRSVKNKQVGAFVQRCNLHINYPAELISTSVYPRYLSAHTCSSLSSH